MALFSAGGSHALLCLLVYQPQQDREGYDYRNSLSFKTDFRNLDIVLGPRSLWW